MTTRWPRAKNSRAAEGDSARTLSSRISPCETHVGGIGYQTLLNMLLRERMSSSPRALRDEIRDIVREEIQRAG
jgi:hypothetical protein